MNEDRIFWLAMILLGISAVLLAGLISRYAYVLSAPLESYIG